MLSLGRGQSLEDKLYAVKYFISGQGLTFVVLKATTSELLGPKKKHLNYLITATNEPNVSVPRLVKYLMQRARHPEWQVAFKSLITIHHLMSYGNEKFIQNMASSTVDKRSFERLSNFVDRTSTQASDMSIFLRRYSRYLDVKINTYRLLGTDFCKIRAKSNLSPLRKRNMDCDHIEKTLPILQGQFDMLIAFDASAKDLNNGIINSAFLLLYKDFVKLYITYQTAIIRVLELYFKTSHFKRARGLLDAYKKFLIRMDKVSDFMRVVDSIGMDKSDMPNVSSSPSISLKLLERHVDRLEFDNRRHHIPPTPIPNAEIMRDNLQYMSGSEIGLQRQMRSRKRRANIPVTDSMSETTRKKDCSLEEQISLLVCCNNEKSINPLDNQFISSNSAIDKRCNEEDESSNKVVDLMLISDEDGQVQDCIGTFHPDNKWVQVEL